MIQMFEFWDKLIFWLSRELWNGIAIGDWMVAKLWWPQTLHHSPACLTNNKMTTIASLKGYALSCMSLCCFIWNVIVFCGPQDECILYRYSYVNVCIIHACASSSSSSTPPKISRITKLTCFVSWVVWVIGVTKLVSWCFVVLLCAQVFHTCFSSLICCLVFL